MNRVLPAARLQLVTWHSMVGWPWGMLAAAFAVNVAFYASMGDLGRTTVTGGLVTIYMVVLAALVQSVTQWFPFALGLGVTRRAFYLSHLLLLAAQALLYAVVLHLLSIVEELTDGWWIKLRFFGIPALFLDNPVLQLLGYAVPFLLLGMLGTAVGVVFKRWGSTGLLLLGLVGILVGGALATLLTWQGWWSAIGSWFAGQGATALILGWPALLALLLAVAVYPVIRRATP
ncbi:ABC transporter permease [Polymorphospora sp. NPDC050346]|uniref:ABC transporter permease n=1 Tax=Polymorphospora sp. NPDC050346 TaxID=3155780 RepID=UPI0033FA38B8